MTEDAEGAPRGAGLRGVAVVQRNVRVPFRTRKPLLDSDAREELESMSKEIPLSLSAILSDTWTQWRESCGQPVDLRLLLPTYTQSTSTISLAILGDTS